MNGKERAMINETLLESEIEELKKGHKINTIKSYRDRTGSGLKDSKEAVDEWIKEHDFEYVDDRSKSLSKEERKAERIRYFIYCELYLPDKPDLKAVLIEALFRYDNNINWLGLEGVIRRNYPDADLDS